MKKMRFAAVALFLAVFVFSLAGEGAAGSKMKLTINNKTSRKVNVAVTFDPGASIITKGWYNVDAGKSKTVTIDEFYGTSWFGYYAEGGGKVWPSGGGSHPLGKLPIHPTKGFTNSIADGGGDDSILPGSVYVGFSRINFKESGGTDTASITFK